MRAPRTSSDTRSMIRMLTLPLGYHSTRLIFRCAGVTDPMGFGVAFGPYLDGNVAADVADIVATTFVSSGMWSAAGVSTSYTFSTVQDTQMLADGPVTAVQIVDSVGAASATVVTPNVAVLVRKVTSLGGATNRGRFYLPAWKLTEANVDNAGIIATTALNSIQSQLTAWLAALVTAGLDMVLLHTDPLETPTPVTGLSIQSVIATQRRRVR